MMVMMTMTIIKITITVAVLCVEQLSAVGLVDFEFNVNLLNLD